MGCSLLDVSGQVLWMTERLRPTPNPAPLNPEASTAHRFAKTERVPLALWRRDAWSVAAAQRVDLHHSCALCGRPPRTTIDKHPKRLTGLVGMPEAYQERGVRVRVWQDNDSVRHAPNALHLIERPAMSVKPYSRNADQKSLSFARVTCSMTEDLDALLPY